MGPHNRPPTTPEGDTDSGSGTQRPTEIPPILHIVESRMDKTRTTRARVRKEITQDYENQLSEIQERMIKYFEDEKATRKQIERDRLQRLSEAIEKKAACEDGIFDILEKLKKETEKVNGLMNSVYTGRHELTTVKFQAGGT